MNKNLFFRPLLSLAVLFAIFTVSLPGIGYAQAAAVSQAGQAQSDLQSRLSTFEQKADARRKELGIPGVALVIVKDDQIIFMKGLGYKDFEKQVPVTPDTQFAIGSATKAFTALTALMSADE